MFLLSLNPNSHILVIQNAVWIIVNCVLVNGDFRLLTYRSPFIMAALSEDAVSKLCNFLHHIKEYRLLTSSVIFVWTNECQDVSELAYPVCCKEKHLFHVSNMFLTTGTCIHSLFCYFCQYTVSACVTFVEWGPSKWLLHCWCVYLSERHICVHHIFKHILCSSFTL